MRRKYRRRRERKRAARKFVNKIVKTVLHRQIENKVYDSPLAASTITYTGGVFDVCTGLAVGTGTSGSGRIGLKVKPISFSFRYHIQGNPNTTISQIVRVVIFRARKEAGTSPTASSLFQVTGATDSWLSPYNWEQLNTNKYTILWDAVHTIGGGNVQSNTAATAYYAAQPYDRVFLKNFYGKKVAHTLSFVGAATTIADGGFYIACISNAGANGPTIDGYARLIYEDA